MSSKDFASSAAPNLFNPDYPVGDLFTPIEYLDHKGETVIAVSDIHIGSNTGASGLQREAPDLAEITFQLIRDVASGALTAEEAKEAKFVRVPDFGNMHITRYDMETYASLKVFGLYEQAQDTQSLAIAKDVYPTGYAAHVKRRSDLTLPNAHPV